MLTILLITILERVTSHGALYIPTPRNAIDASLPEFKGGKSPIEACTCNNGNVSWIFSVFALASTNS